METKEIILSIQHRRSSGMTDEQIMASLVNQGLSDQEINRLMELSQGPVEELEKEIKSSEPQKKKKRWWSFFGSNK